MPEVIKLHSTRNLLRLVSLGWRFRYGCMWTLTVLIARLSCQFSAILTKPMNTVSLVGNKTKMECSRNVLHLPVDWEFAPAGSNSFSYIFADGRITENVTSRYRIDTDGEIRYDIVIDSVDLSHAGKYRCTVHESATAELIVLESDPVCETDVRASKGVIVDGDYIQMWCTITYNGNWQPVTTHNRSTRNNDTASSGLSMSQTSTTISPTIFIQLTSSDNGVTITWKTSFKPPSTATNTTQKSFATNVPHYQHLWNYRANVSYSVRDLTIEPNSSIYEVGDRLMCSAAGNPSPAFQWTETGANRVIDGPILNIDETMPLMQNLTFKCTATNTVAGESKAISDVVTFIVTATPGLWNPITIGLTVAGVTALIVLLALGLAKALTVKARGKGDSVNPRILEEASNDVDEFYEVIDESKIQSGENIASDGYASLHDSSSATVAQQAAYDQLQNIASDGYASLHDSSSATVAQQAAYDQLQLYLNPIDIDVEAT